MQNGTGGGSPVAVAGPVASRRVTSVLFGDLVGFTSLSETRDQEDVRELLSTYFEECRQIIARYGGTVEKFIGDAVMAVWGVPTSHEDDAERAVRAGLELVNRIAALGSDVGVPDLAMRVGIVTGEVAVTIGAQQQGMVAGDAVNTASRVQSAAEAGQVWVDETTRLLTSSAISYLDVGSHAMKGKAEPMPLWSVRAVVAAVGGAQRADGLEAPLVGRDRELRLVKEIFHGVEASRRPSLLVVDGEPGLGKSRLGWEFEKYIDGLSKLVRWHSGRCLSYGEGVAFYALAEAIRSRLQRLTADDTDGDLEPAQLLAAGLERFVPDPAERTWLGPRLGALLGTGAVGSYPREDLFAAWATFLHRVSEEDTPVVLVIDDAQHADDGLLMFLEYLLGVGSFPCLVVLFTRPGLLEQHPSLATNRRATVLHLETLSPPDMADLLDGLVVGLPDAVRSSLVTRAEGIPLFAVETVRSLIDRDLVVPRGGQYVLASPDSLDLDAIGAPASLQALITARLDTLPATQRRVLDQASVIGSSFTRDAIANLCPDLADLDGDLAALVRLQLLRRESNRFSNEAGQFQFVQSAVRQISYGTLSRRDRKASHLAVVRLLEAEGDESGELAPIIAQHYMEALDAVPDDADRQSLSTAAVAQLQRAATRTAALGAPREAADHLAVALRRCDDPVLIPRIQVELADQLTKAGRYESAIEHAEVARDALDAAGQSELAVKAVSVLAHALIGAGGFERAFAVADERRAAAAALDPALELILIRAMISARLRIGGEIRDLSEDSARLAEKLGDRNQIANSYVSLALHYMTKGPHGLGRMLLESAAEIAREAHDGLILCRALGNLNADWTQDDAARAAEYGREAAAAARSLGDHYWTSSTALNLTFALTVQGAWDEALACSAGDAVDPLDRSMGDLMRGRILLARGQEWERFVPVGRDGDDDPVLGGVPSDRHRAGRAAARAGARPDCGDERDPGNVHPHGDLRRLQHALADRLRPRLGRPRPGGPGRPARDRGRRPAQQVDSGAGGTVPTDPWPAGHRGRCRAGLDRAPSAVRGRGRRGVALGSDGGRALADLGVWLTREGRAAEAGEPLERAREIFERLGAVSWSAQLDAELSGVHA